MRSKWQVMHNYAGGAMFYQVYRLLDVDGVDHSGNREVIGFFDDEAHAQEFADIKNKMEGNDD